MSSKTQSQRLDALHKLDQQIDEAQALLLQLQEKRQALRQAAQHEEIEQLEKHFSESRVRLKDLVTLAEVSWQEIKRAVDELLKDSH